MYVMFTNTRNYEGSVAKRYVILLHWMPHPPPLSSKREKSIESKWYSAE
jgi:hypothetical protein